VAEYLALALTPQALFLTIFFIVSYFRLVFYLGTASLQLSDLNGLRRYLDADSSASANSTSSDCSGTSMHNSTDIAASAGIDPERQDLEDEVQFYLSLLGWIAPLGAVAAPMAGYAYDVLGAFAATSLVFVLGCIHSVCAIIPVLELQPVTFLSYSLQQEAIFAVILARILDVMGSHRFGIMAGLLFAIGSLCAIVVTPSTALVLRNDHGEFLHVNIALVVLTAASGLYLWRLWNEDHASPPRSPNRGQDSDGDGDAKALEPKDSDAGNETETPSEIPAKDSGTAIRSSTSPDGIDLVLQSQSEKIASLV